MPYTQSILSPDPLYLDPKTYDARADRKVLQDLIGPGVVGGGFLVSLTSGMGISVAGGVAYVLGGNITDQGMYRQYIQSAVLMTVTASNPTNPRLDQVILRVLDNAADGSTFNEARIEIVPGTPTAGATLDNRNGAANLNTLTDASKSLILLADILVPAGAVSLTGANLRDKRQPAYPKNVSERSTTLSVRPAASTRPEGYIEYTADEKRLYRVAGGSWEPITLPNIWPAALVRCSFTLSAGTTPVTISADSGTRVVDLDNASITHATPDMTLYAPSAGYYLYYARHRTAVAGNIGLEVLKTGSGGRIAYDNKTALFSGLSAPNKNDDARCFGMVFLDPGQGDKLSLFFAAWHSAGAIDLFEVAMMKIPGDMTLPF